jgi:hypothetical protein
VFTIFGQAGIFYREITEFVEKMEGNVICFFSTTSVVSL